MEEPEPPFHRCKCGRKSAERLEDGREVPSWPAQCDHLLVHNTDELCMSENFRPSSLLALAGPLLDQTAIFISPNKYPSASFKTQSQPHHSFVGGPTVATLFGTGGAKMPKVAAASASTAASFGKAAPGAKLQLTAAAPKGQPMGKPFFVQTGPVFGIH